jgi:glutamate-1-semialdehyde 2,1-aminomutase
MWGLFFTAGPVHSYDDARQTDTALFARWHKAALARGVFLAPSSFEAAFVSSAHSESDIDFTIRELDVALGEARGR